jgi:zinc/manganese transport system permease protein
VAPKPSWNVLHDVSQLLEYHFMINALLGGSVVAVMAGVVGWVMVLRRETFAGHTLAMMAFPGASGAALIGVPAAWGYFAFCGAGALALGRSRAPGEAWSERSANTGVAQSLALAVGFLFVSLYGGVLADLESFLFGDVLAVSDGQLLALVAIAAAALVLLACAARPLLFASVDAEGAAARGVPVRALSSAFLLLLGLTVAATSQITGVLLVFALLVAPAASAQALTTRPLLSLAITVALGLLVVWLGLGIAYFSIYPAGFWITAIAFASYVIARLAAIALARRSRRREPLLFTPAPRPGVIG